jgi:hypothetical protein
MPSLAHAAAAGWVIGRWLALAGGGYAGWLAGWLAAGSDPEYRRWIAPPSHQPSCPPSCDDVMSWCGWGTLLLIVATLVYIVVA